MSNAKELSEVLKNLPCHVNLIKLNEVKERGLKAPTTDTCEKFLTALYKYKVSATLRRTIGDDVDGACGQLRFKAMNEKTGTAQKYAVPVKVEKKTSKTDKKSDKFDKKDKKTGKFDNKKTTKKDSFGENKGKNRQKSRK